MELELTGMDSNTDSAISEQEAFSESPALLVSAF